MGGEAKRRGTFEERKAAAIKRDIKIQEEQKHTEIVRRQNMSPKEITEEKAIKTRAAKFVTFVMTQICKRG